MSERKVLNKYYPPDFDPAKIPRLRLPKDRQYTVRLMAPCNMRCTTCGEYIYKGKKFNARKETVQNEEYLGIKIFRFYIKCPRCLAEITFKTDPQNADYIVENGASRNFQALKLAEEQAEREAKEQEEEEKNNPMKLLENRTKASKQEMDLLESLAELKDLNQRHAHVDFNQMLGEYAKYDEKLKKQQEDEDEAFIREVFGHSNKRDAEDIEIEEEVGTPKILRSDSCMDKSKPEKVADKTHSTEKNSIESSKLPNLEKVADKTHGTEKNPIESSKLPNLVADKAHSTESSKLPNFVRTKKTNLLSNLVRTKKAVPEKQTPADEPSKPVSSPNGLSLLGTYLDSDSSD